MLYLPSTDKLLLLYYEISKMGIKFMKICGLQKTTLLDFPGHVAATVFTGGCNFRCPFCQNAEIITADAESGYTDQEVLSFLKKRSGILEGICITGGEPTLQADLADFAEKVKSFGLLVKLDTNGYRPDVLKHMVTGGLLDYVAMDIKAGPDHYKIVSGLSHMDLSPIKESMDFLLSGKIPFEFRTTVVKGLHTKTDFEQIGPWIKGCPQYFLQNFKESEYVLQPGFTGFSPSELQEFADVVKPFVGSVSIRGVDF